MSNYMVSKEQLKLLAVAYTEVVLDKHEDEPTILEVMKCLYTANLLSVAENDAINRTVNKLDFYEDDLTTCDPTLLYYASPVVLLKQIENYEYQACDSKTWSSSKAKDMIDKLRIKMIMRLPGFHDAPWGVRAEHFADHTIKAEYLCSMSYEKIAKVVINALQTKVGRVILDLSNVDISDTSLTDLNKAVHKKLFEDQFINSSRLVIKARKNNEATVIAVKVDATRP